jgi:hypothetical protein
MDDQALSTPGAVRRCCRIKARKRKEKVARAMLNITQRLSGKTTKKVKICVGLCLYNSTGQLLDGDNSILRPCTLKMFENNMSRAIL